MNRRQRARFRLEAFDYARRFLGVKRLPNGVPALIREYVASCDEIPEYAPDQMAQMLAPYRRRVWVS